MYIYINTAIDYNRICIYIANNMMMGVSGNGGYLQELPFEYGNMMVNQQMVGFSHSSQTHLGTLKSMKSTT